MWFMVIYEEILTVMNTLSINRIHHFTTNTHIKSECVLTLLQYLSSREIVLKIMEVYYNCIVESFMIKLHLRGGIQNTS